MEATIFLTKSEENLTAARLCLQNGLCNASANHSYYAMFLAAVAILLARGVTFDPKQHLDHTPVRSLFSNELIHRRKIFPNKFNRYLNDALLVRGQADYEPQTISQKKAHRQMAQAYEFVEIIKKEFNHV